MAETLLDPTDWRILEILQRDARISFVTLGKEVAMSASAVTERVRRLEAADVISAYTATVEPARVGMSIMAFVRLGYPTGNYKPLHDLLASTPHVLEAHHVTGEDCFILKVVAPSMQDLETITGRLAVLGSIATNVVYSSPLPRRDLTADLASDPG